MKRVRHKGTENRASGTRPGIPMIQNLLASALLCSSLIGCASRGGPREPQAQSTAKPAARVAQSGGGEGLALFQSSVRPILATRCTPCHEPGGKMYERLPFDEPSVVSSHREGVLRRLKGEDRDAVERWFSSLSPPGSSN